MSTVTFVLFYCDIYIFLNVTKINVRAISTSSGSPGIRAAERITVADSSQQLARPTVSQTASLSQGPTHRAQATPFEGHILMATHASARDSAPPHLRGASTEEAGLSPFYSVVTKSRHEFKPEYNVQMFDKIGQCLHTHFQATVHTSA